VNTAGAGDALAALRWLAEAGADEAIEMAPRDRFVAPDTTPTANAPPVQADTTATANAPPVQADTPLARATAAAQACQSIAELAEAVAGFDGCALKRTAKNTVFADGDPEADLMLIGEAPGADEDRTGVPFVGAAGRLLDRMLAAISRDRSRAYITNIVFWRPPGNRNPSPEEIALCLPFVERHVALANPRALVFVGGVAAKTLLERGEGITRLRGRWFNYAPAGMAQPIPAIALYHPAYLLRQPARKREAWHDLLAIQARLEST